ncbi:MAG: peptidoglycan DD-metalloendopeptidase family protein [Candidatus Marinarcus sp.]|uniref:peptidoglycan DD-metalloendopeptidase family protein n=1 Tax=Candidatus Marinarcus sp. TaxID=3100987 RepID=UPI003B00D1EB
MRIIYTLLLIITTVFGAELKELPWKKGDTFLTFLQDNNIPQELYFNLEKNDRELCSEIVAGVNYQELRGENNELLQVLIPISEEMQLHLYKEKGEFLFTTTPIAFQEVTQTISIPVHYSPYQDILDATSNQALANEFARSFKRLANFKQMRKGDNIAIKYTQRIRMGEYYGTPNIEAALIEIRNKQTYIFKNEADGRYYDEKGRTLTSFFMTVPVAYKRISDRFTYKRWHPVLKRYRAHLGIDYAAPAGRKIYAAASGRVVFEGRKGGYGKTVEIKHEGNYKSLYGHMSKFAAGIRPGKWVKQGTLIGYVGSTGVSTGPHLHFGLYKNGRAINPSKIIRVTKNELKGKQKQQFILYAKALSQDLLETIKSRPEPLNITKIDKQSKLNAEV